MHIAVVVGNPKAASRTRTVAEAVAERIRTAVAAGDDESPMIRTIEVAELGPALLGWGDPAVAEALDVIRTASALVVASPTYKATYTGLLKLLLDQIGQGELAGLPTVPVMVAAAPQHAMAADVHLRPVLVEVGASCPTPAVFVLDGELEALDAVLDRWAERGVPALEALVRTVSAA